MILVDIEKRIELIKKPPTEEVITEDNLRNLLQAKEHPRHYIGFEISGKLHLGNFLLSGFKVNDFAEAGIDTCIYLADWHSVINNKLGGDWDNILRAAKYYEEAFKFLCPSARIELGSDLYHQNDEYWKDIIRFSKNLTLSRISRCLTIMGRSETESLDFSQYLYPPMQGVDVKYLGEDLPHGGMDQRKVHVLAREVYPKMGWGKPVAVHHHLLAGLSEPVKAASGDKLDQVIASKMSKSKPKTAVFIHDTPEEINDKLLKAWCPERIVEQNPVVELLRYIVFHEKDAFTMEREERYGGELEFHSYDEFEKEYVSGSIHPMDLKVNVAREINAIIKPYREHFEKPAYRKLLGVYDEAQITR